MSPNLEKLIDETAQVMGPDVAGCLTDAGAIKTAKKYLVTFAKKLEDELTDPKPS